MISIKSLADSGLWSLICKYLEMISVRYQRHSSVSVVLLRSWSRVSNRFVVHIHPGSNSQWGLVLMMSRWKHFQPSGVDTLTMNTFVCHGTQRLLIDELQCEQADTSVSKTVVWKTISLSLSKFVSKLRCRLSSSCSTSFHFRAVNSLSHRHCCGHHKTTYITVCLWCIGGILICISKIIKVFKPFGNNSH